MSQGELNRWERGFRAAAKADKYTILRDHLRRLQLPDSPELLVDGTICVVQACSCHYAIEGRVDEFEQFLEMQHYNPENAPAAQYAFTFDLCGRAFARVLVKTKVQTLDLADLYGNRWSDYEVVGYRQFWISRADWGELTGEELRQLEDEVIGDLRFDYPEDELLVSFDDSVDDAYLLVAVQDA